MPRPRSWPFLLTGLLVALLYSTHLLCCQRSTLQFLDAIATSSDMHANLVWANGIYNQGWLNPHPYHPWNDWMQSIAPYPQWVQWWGGEQKFQQSPLYAYVLTLFLHKYFAMRVLQALLSVATCVFIGLFAARIGGRAAGWLAFWLAALYAPFYLYAWPFLRDGLGWFLTAALLWALAELTHAAWPSPRGSRFAWLAGLLLGLGFLAKETYLLLIPLTWAAVALFAWNRRQWALAAQVILATILALSPLLLRNWFVKAPLLSSSNRFAETFIEGNSATSSPYILMAPQEMPAILRQSHGQTFQIIRATIASHPNGFRGFIWLQLLKLRSLLDPYESPDNLSFYFVAHISPLVRFGLRYWMLLPPAAAGLLLLSLRRRDPSHVWIWIFLPVSLVSLLVGVPLSRYRQSLMLILIPCAAYFLVWLYALISRRQYRGACYSAIALIAGWLLILGPLAHQPRGQYERPSEYVVSAQIYHLLGDQQKERAMLAFIRQNFPGAFLNNAPAASPGAQPASHPAAQPEELRLPITLSVP
jgi:4-amino-4-deoxy-L-arabinose transferase-like glycosyltransferase